MFSCLFTKLPNPFFPLLKSSGESGKCFLTPGQLSVFITGRNLGCFKGTVQSKSTITFENAPQMCDVLVFMAFFFFFFWLGNVANASPQHHGGAEPNCEVRNT